MDFLLTYGLGRMKHFSFVYFSMLLHDSGEGCSHFVLERLISLMVDGLRGSASCVLIGTLKLVYFQFVALPLKIVKLLRCEEIEEPISQSRRQLNS